MPSREGSVIGIIGVLALAGLVLVLLVYVLPGPRPSAATNPATPSPASPAGAPRATVTALPSALAPTPRPPVPPAVILPGWVIYQGQKDKFSYAHPPDWKLSADAAGKTVYNLRAGGFWSALTDWTWSQGQPDDFAARIERQIADAGTYTGLSFSVLNKKPIGDSVHEGYIVEGELKSPGAGYWLNYAYLRSYHDSVLVLYYFREKSQANGGDPQTFAAVVASERDGDVAIVDKYP